MDLEQQKKQFGIQAEDYTKYRKPYPQELTDFFFSVAPKGNIKVLDLACGTGKSTEPLVREGIEVFGCDHDSLMIEEAQKQAALKSLQITYAVAEAEKLPYVDNTFDAINVGTAFHWFVNEASMQEIARVLKLQSLLFIFWTMTKDDPRLDDSSVAQVFQNYKWQRVPSEFRNQEYITNFLIKSGFNGSSTHTISTSHQETVEERVGLEKTNSGYGMLSVEDKKSFLSDLEVALKAQLSGKPYFTLNEEIQVCYAYKR